VVIPTDTATGSVPEAGSVCKNDLTAARYVAAIFGVTTPGSAIQLRIDRHDLLLHLCVVRQSSLPVTSLLEDRGDRSTRAAADRTLVPGLVERPVNAGDYSAVLLALPEADALGLAVRLGSDVLTHQNPTAPLGVVRDSDSVRERRPADLALARPRPARAFLQSTY